MRKLVLAAASIVAVAGLAACGESAADKAAEQKADALEAQAAATPNEAQEQALNAEADRIEQQAGNAGKRRGEREGERDGQARVDADRFGHHRVLRRGAQAAADGRTLQEQMQRQHQNRRSEDRCQRLGRRWAAGQ